MSRHVVQPGPSRLNMPELSERAAGGDAGREGGDFFEDMGEAVGVLTGLC